MSELDVASVVVLDGRNDGLDEFEEDEQVQLHAQLSTRRSQLLHQTLHHLNSTTTALTHTKETVQTVNHLKMMLGAVSGCRILPYELTANDS